MATLYRVFPCQPEAAPVEPGGALYIPPQGAGRIDNPGLYAVLYLSDTAEGAIAEAFGRFPEWTPAILAGSPALPGSTRAIAQYRFRGELPLCDLDDAVRLLALELRPSQVVTRDYTQTRAWARTIFEQGRWAGIRWWSYYRPEWGSIGLWSVAALTLETVRPLCLDDVDLIAASRTIARRVTAAAARKSGASR
ncbi:MAG: RES domain-containing protein [Bryobacteraceae bacterium]|nr:RES domain-containing protein [Bryobacteraceae bacterium]